MNALILHGLTSCKPSGLKKCEQLFLTMPMKGSILLTLNAPQGRDGPLGHIRQ